MFLIQEYLFIYLLLEDFKKWKDISCAWIDRANIVKMDITKDNI